VLLLDWNKCRSFERYALGFSYADDGEPWRLRRRNPVPHPRFPWLTATTVSFTAFAPLANPEQDGTYVPGIYPDSFDVAQYQKVYATVRFTDRPWTFLPDQDVPSYLTECQRNTYFNPSPSVEMISAEGLNNLRFANGTSATTVIPAPFGTLMSKNLLALRWMWVPNEYISGDSTLTFTPKWIDSVVGRVNNAEFLGYPARTLLLQAPQYERFRFPYAPASKQTPGFFGWNVTFPIQYFDPPRGYDATKLFSGTGGTSGVLTFDSTTHGTYLGVEGTIDLEWGSSGEYREDVTVDGTSATTLTFSGGTGNLLPAVNTAIKVYDNRYRGHQLVPRRTDLLWYGAYRELGGKLYQEADFSNLFRHVGEY
jgi:hypothetical protein